MGCRLRAPRLRALAERVELLIGVDSGEGAEVLADALAGTEAEVADRNRQWPPSHRRGTRARWEVAAAAQHKGLSVAGLFTFPGHSYEPGRRKQAAMDEAQALRQADASLRQAGVGAALRSGGSTPTAALAIEGALNEMRPGVYVFNDAQQVELGAAGWDDVALTAAATVVSRHGRDLVLDAGGKVLGADRPIWATGVAGCLTIHRHESAPCPSTMRRQASPKTVRCPSLIARPGRSQPCLRCGQPRRRTRRHSRRRSRG